jgi:hypothetical protein
MTDPLMPVKCQGVFVCSERYRFRYSFEYRRGADSKPSLRRGFVIRLGVIVAKGKGGGKPAVSSNDGRNNKKAFKKLPKTFDVVKRRLVTVK